jgi:hypothetical protein
VERSSLTAIPSTFCAFVTLKGLIPEESRGWLKVVRGSSGRTKLGVCGAAIEREAFSLSAEHRTVTSGGVTTTANIDRETTWQRQSLGPSVSYQLTDDLTLGLSMHVVTTASKQSDSISLLSGQSGSSQQAATYQRQARASSIDGATTFGITYAVGRLTSGLSLRLPSIRFSDSARLTRFESPTTGPASLAAASGSLRAPLPPVVTLGTGLEWEEASLEFDVAANLGGWSAFHTALSEETTSSDDGRTTTRRALGEARGRSAVSFRTGGEWYLSPTLSLLGGARYEPSRVTVSSRNAVYRIAPTDESTVAGSLGLGSYGRGTELLLGTEVSYGWGRVPISTPSLSGTGETLAEERTWAALIVLSGSVGLSAVRQTLDNFKALRPKPDE